MTKIGSLCVYCGSSPGNDPAYREAAARLGRMLASRGIRLIFGGGHVGLMGIAADAVLAGGGEVVGVMPKFLMEIEAGHPGVTRLELVSSMHERKERLFRLADAFAILPGGLGTLDETLEIITWKQLRLHDKPIVIVDVAGYWAELRALIEAAIARGFAKPDVRDLYSVVSSVDAVFSALAALPGPRIAAEPGQI